MYDIICDICKFQGQIDCDLNKSQCNLKSENKNKEIVIITEKPVIVVTNRNYYCKLHEFKHEAVCGLQFLINYVKDQYTKNKSYSWNSDNNYEFEFSDCSRFWKIVIIPKKRLVKLYNTKFIESLEVRIGKR